MNSKINKSQIDELFRKADIHKALVGFAYNAYAKQSLKGLAKLVNSINDPIEKMQATKWLEAYGCIFNTHAQSQNGELISAYRYKPTLEFQFDLENAWSNPYYSQSMFQLAYPFLNDATISEDTNIFSPYWFVQPDKVKENLIKALDASTPNDTAIRKTLENAINAFWRSHKHDAAIRSSQENAQLMFKLDAEKDANLSKQIVAKTSLMIEDYFNSERAKLKSHASLPSERIRPSENKPKEAEECYVCSGNGKTSIGRLCSRCMGRGFTLKVSDKGR